MTGRKRSGFTLIELLVVIAIIGILAAIGTYAHQTGQARARDTQRKADLQTIASVLERYYADHGFYPDSFFNSEISEGRSEFNFYLSTSNKRDWICDIASCLTPLPQDPQQVAFKIDWLAKFFNHPSLTFPPQVSAQDEYESCRPTEPKVFGTDPDDPGRNDANINDDWIIDNRDTLVNLQEFGTDCLHFPGLYKPEYDMNNNGQIDLTDTLIVLANFGCPNPEDCQQPPGYFYYYQTPLEIPSDCTRFNCSIIIHPHRSYILWAKLENKNDSEIWSSETAKCQENPTNPVSISTLNIESVYHDTGYCVTSKLPARY